MEVQATSAEFHVGIARIGVLELLFWGLEAFVGMEDDAAAFQFCQSEGFWAGDEVAPFLKDQVGLEEVETRGEGIGCSSGDC